MIHKIISIPNLEDEIDLINFNTTETFYVTNNKTLETSYEERNFKIYFDDLFLFSGKFIGLDESKNDIELLDESSFQVSSNKGLRYKLSESEKSKKGVRLKIKIGTNSISPKDFIFFICLNGYKICDADQKMKCLNEGFYYDSINDKYYSCYETCGSCESFKKPDDSNYNKHYCDTCKSNYPYYINMVEQDENENDINYLNCYEKCPSHAPYLKYSNLKECSSSCPNFSTNENKCIDYCDSKKYKYLLESEKICYNYIPDNYFIYIDNYDEKYYDDDNPIIKLINECPKNYSNDTSFTNICINSVENIFHLI